MNEKSMPDQHIQSAFDRDLEGIQANIMKMGGLVEDAIRKGAVSLVSRDEALADQVRQGDVSIDLISEQVNQDAARVIAARSDSRRFEADSECDQDQHQSRTDW